MLLEAEPLHGKKSAVLHYNLACDYSLLGEIENARACLEQACKMHADFKNDALGDSDLEAIWNTP